MRRIIFQNMVSLDGYFEGPGREIDWHVVDSEFNDYANDFLKSVDTLLFGRVTYEGMASYWPTEMAVRDDPIIARLMNSLAKIVVSTTLKKVEWNNTRLIHENVIEEISCLKQQPGKDIAIFGSSDLAVPLIQAGLIDEIRIYINPVILGGGKPIFKGIKNRLKLKLISTKVFQSGNVLLSYQPEKGEA